MKKIFTILCILFFLNGNSQSTTIITYSDTSGRYIVRYKYNQSKEAKIAVYKIRGIDTIMVGEVFRGVYVPNESLKKYILKAKKLKDNK